MSAIASYSSMMQLTCYVLSNSVALPDADLVLGAFDPTNISTSERSIGCVFDSTACVIHLSSVSHLAWDSGVPYHKSQMMVHLVDMLEPSTPARSSKLKLAKRMTALLTRLSTNTETVRISWQEFLLHEMKTWVGWCDYEIPTALWVDISGEKIDSGYQLRTTGLGWFGRPEVCLNTTAIPDDDTFEQVRAFADYLICLDEQVTAGSAVEFSSNNCESDQLVVRVKELMDIEGREEVHIEVSQVNSTD